MPSLRRNLAVAKLTLAAAALSMPFSQVVSVGPWPFDDAPARRRPEHRRRKKFKGYQRSRKR